MKNETKLFLMAILGWSAAANALHIPGFGKHKDEPTEALPSGSFTNRLSVVKVDVAKKHLFSAAYGNWGRWSETNNPCQDFKGTFEGNTVYFHAEAQGGVGSLRQTLVTKFNSSYQLGLKDLAQVQYVKDGASADFAIKLPFLNDDVPYVQQSVELITEDSAGHSTTANFVFTVSRPVILSVSEDPKAIAQNCFQRYAPYEAIAGVLANATNNVSTIQIHQGIEKLWTSTKGWQWGVYVQPQAFGISIIAVDYSYFQETSKTVSETTEVVTDYNFDPGDYMQVYAQPTRYITMYDASLVDACGGQTLVSGAYAFQWWGFAYQVHPVNPYSTQAIDLNSVGAPMMDTCPETLDSSNGKTESFWRTN